MPEFVHSTKYIQDLRNHEIVSQLEIERDRNDARLAQRLRDKIGHRLIAIGERLVEKPSSELGLLDRAA